MKIYTKTGDQGMTGLYGGARVSKNSPRIAAYGDVDELNSSLGVVAALTPHEPIRKALVEVQAALFGLGAHLASPKSDPKIERISAKHTDGLERQIDVISEALSPMKNFILPGGGQTSAFLHLSRTICRRAERNVITLSGLPDEPVDEWIVIYLNRLSDFLFTLARLANQLENIDDVPWLPPKFGK